MPPRPAAPPAAGKTLRAPLRPECGEVAHRGNRQVRRGLLPVGEQRAGRRLPMGGLVSVKSSRIARRRSFPLCSESAAASSSANAGSAVCLSLCNDVEDLAVDPIQQYFARAVG